MAFAEFLISNAALERWYAICDERDDYVVPPSRELPNLFKPGETMLFTPARGTVHITAEGLTVAVEVSVGIAPDEPESPNAIVFSSNLEHDPGNHERLENFADSVLKQLPDSKVAWLLSSESPPS